MKVGAFSWLVDAREIDRINRNLKTYAEIRYQKSEDEILNAKGNDLRIALFKLFFAQRWLKGKKLGAFRLLKNLAASGKGVLVRLMSLVSPWAGKIPTVDKNGKALSMWQKLVAQEMLRRSAGVGVLGISFLRKRWRTNKEGSWLAENRTRGFGKAVTFEKQPHAFMITGFTPGLGRVAVKYGILSNAVALVSADIENYIARKLGPEFLKTLHAS